MRLTDYLRQLERDDEERLERCGLFDSTVSEADQAHDTDLAERDRAADHAPAPTSLPDCTCGRGTESRYAKHPGHRYSCPRYSRVPTSRDAA